VWRAAIDAVRSGKAAHSGGAGAASSELPVQAPTAKVLGLNIPAAFPLRADEVIE
jgi:hypothetical protein